MIPARLPESEADLPAWQAYAEELSAAGDPRGELMLIDLSLPADLDRDQVRGFQIAGNRLCRFRPNTPAAWRLAHVRGLTIRNHGMHWRRSPPEHGSFANACERLATAAGSRVERLATTWPIDTTWRPWLRLMRALPPSCRTLDLLILEDRALPTEQVLASLPPTVREIRPRLRTNRPGAEAWTLIDDRLERVDLGEVLLPDADRAAIGEALARTSRVRVRVNRWPDPLPFAGRIQLGDPDDAALIQPGGAGVAVLERWPLALLQQRHGLIPVRAQLGRRLPEGHGVTVRDGVLVTSMWSNDLVRRGDAWTLRGLQDRVTRVNGRAVATHEIVAIHDGDQLDLGDVRAVLRARAGDVPAT